MRQASLTEYSTGVGSVCPVCGRRFRSIRSLRTHVRKAHTAKSITHPLSGLEKYVSVMRKKGMIEIRLTVTDPIWKNLVEKSVEIGTPIEKLLLSTILSLASIQLKEDPSYIS